MSDDSSSFLTLFETIKKSSLQYQEQCLLISRKFLDLRFALLQCFQHRKRNDERKKWYFNMVNQFLLKLSK